MHKFELFCLLFLACILTIALQPSAADDRLFYLNYEGYHVPNPPKHLVLYDVYSYQQTTNYTCGPAIVMTLMHRYGKLKDSEMNRATEMRIANEMGTTMVDGTSQIKIAEWLKQHGFSVSYGQNVSIDMLIDNINRGVMTIIVWNDINAHAMMVIGYHAEKAFPSGDDDVIFTADPASSGYIVENGHTLYGIDTLTANQLELNQFNTRYFFNPSHSASGLYITAVPN